MHIHSPFSPFFPLMFSKSRLNNCTQNTYFLTLTKQLYTSYKLQHIFHSLHFLAFIVGRLMFSQTCTSPNISFAINMLGKYQNNLEIDHWITRKKVLRRYLQETNNYIFTYMRFNHLEDEYSNSDCQIQGYMIILIWLFFFQLTK